VSKHFADTTTGVAILAIALASLVATSGCHWKMITVVQFLWMQWAACLIAMT
jgi:hypothetical protein